MCVCIYIYFSFFFWNTKTEVENIILNDTKMTSLEKIQKRSKNWLLKVCDEIREA